MKKSLAIIALCCACALAMGLSACGSSSGSAASSAASSSASAASSSASTGPSKEDLAKAEYERASALFDQGKFYSAKVAFEESGYQDWEKRAAECVQPMPATGEMYHNENMTSNNMSLTFDVQNAGSDEGMYIMVSAEDNTLAETLFIQGTGSVETWLPGGNYYVKDASGTVWYGEDEKFGPTGHYERMVFDEFENDRYLTELAGGYAYRITINTSSGGGQDVDAETETWENWE